MAGVLSPFPIFLFCVPFFEDPYVTSWDFPSYPFGSLLTCVSIRKGETGPGFGFEAAFMSILLFRACLCVWASAFDKCGAAGRLGAMRWNKNTDVVHVYFAGAFGARQKRREEALLAVFVRSCQIWYVPGCSGWMDGWMADCSVCAAALGNE